MVIQFLSGPGRTEVVPEKPPGWVEVAEEPGWLEVDREPEKVEVGAEEVWPTLKTVNVNKVSLK